MTRQPIYLLVFCVALASCTEKSPLPGQSLDAKSAIGGEQAKSEAIPAGESAYYEMVEIDEKLPDATYDKGYRTKTLSYPKLIRGSEEVKTRINHQITVLANSFGCRGGKGAEQGFSGKVIYVASKVLSMEYDAIWMCEGPSYNSARGAATYNLVTGTALELASEFVDNISKSRFAATVDKQLIVGVAQKEKDQKCPRPISYNYYYLTDAGLVVGYSPEQHYYSFCATEITVPRKDLKQYVKPDSLLLQY